MTKKQRAKKQQRVRSSQRSWPATSKWVAMGTLVATAVGTQNTFLAQAQQGPAGPQPNPPQPQAGLTHHFKVPSGQLEDILPAFERAAGLHVELANSAIGGMQSPGVNGDYTIEQAFAQLLAGTKLNYRFTGRGVAMVNLTGVSQTVTVTARGGEDPYADPEAPYKAELSSSKFTEPILNTPRAVTILTQEALQDKNATTLREALRSTAGVTLGSGEGGNAFGDRFFIRGFDARNDVFVDGARDPGVSIRENFDAEQIEILRGPASSFAGRGTTGGALNIVTKQAQSETFYHLETEGGFNDTTKRGAADINKALSRVLDARLNGMIQYAGIAGRDYTTDNRWGVAGNLAFHPTADFTLSANFSHTYLWGLPDFGVPYNQVARLPATEVDVPRNTYYGIINRDFTRSAQDVGTLDAAWKVNDHVTFENKFRGSHSLLDYLGTTPENPSCTTPATAAYCSTPTHNSGYVQLNAQSRYEPVDVIVEQPQAILKFDTGPLAHAAVVGGEFSKESLSLDSYAGFTSELTTGPVVITSSGAPIVSEYNPVHYLYGSKAPALTGNPLKYNVDTYAGYVMDTADYHHILIVNGGVRFDDYNIKASNNTTSQSANSGITSSNAGIVYKPIKIGSVYAAFATAAVPVGDELDATSSTYGGLAPTQNSTQIYGPQKSKSYEVGTKWELFQSHLLATAALFQTDVTNARETAPAGLPGYTSGQIVPNAAYRVRGIDLELTGKITNKWSVLGGFVAMNPKVTKSIVPTNVGLDLANIAPVSFNLLSKYQATRWLELGGQGIYASQIKGGSLLAANGNVAYPGAPNPTIIPDHWRFDVFAESRLKGPLSTKLTAQNLFNKAYYDSFYQSAQPFINVAPGRAIYLSLVFRPHSR